MKQVKRVVSVGAHSLDAEIMGGPLFVKYKPLEVKCTLLHVTSGRLEDPNATKEECEAYLQQVYNQNNRAAALLGADVVRLGYQSSNMPSLEEFKEDLMDYFLAEKVDLVITHYRGSMHPRHINTHDAVVAAVKELRAQGSEIKLIYGETFEDLVGFIPQAYFVLTDEEKRLWFKALKQYTVFNGGVNDFPYMDYYSTNLKIRQIEANSTGPTVGFMYASQIEKDVW